MANMLTTKELTLLADLLVYEESASKKAKLYSNSLTDKEISSSLSNLAETHTKRFNSLYSLLGGK